MQVQAGVGVPQQNGRRGVEQLGRADAEVGVNVGPHLVGPAWQATQPTQAPPFSSSCLKASHGNLASTSAFRVCGAWLFMADWRMRPQHRHRLHFCLPSWQLCLCVLFSLGVKSLSCPTLAGHLVSGPRGCSLGEAARRWRLGRGFVVVAASQIHHNAEMDSPQMAARLPHLIILWIQPAAQAPRCFCSCCASAPHPAPNPLPAAWRPARCPFPPGICCKAKRSTSGRGGGGPAVSPGGGKARWPGHVPD